MKKPALGKPQLPAPPTVEQTQAMPTTLARRSTNAKGKGDQINFQCSPELKRDIKLLIAELGITQQDYLEKVHNFYKLHHKGTL
ncbi:hypothetical protein PN823_004485 [Enterobacter hormaechei]|nr:hypothetical protein [Enterobacter hormaechei]